MSSSVGMSGNGPASLRATPSYALGDTSGKMHATCVAVTPCKQKRSAQQLYMGYFGRASIFL